MSTLGWRASDEAPLCRAASPARLNDPRPAKEQFAERYIYGGWRNQDGIRKSVRRYVLLYPGDPPMVPIAAMQLREEIIMIYDGDVVAIWQKDGSFEACRMD